MPTLLLFMSPNGTWMYSHVLHIAAAPTSLRKSSFRANCLGTVGMCMPRAQKMTPRKMAHLKIPWHSLLCQNHLDFPFQSLPVPNPPHPPVPFRRSEHGGVPSWPLEANGAVVLQPSSRPRQVGKRPPRQVGKRPVLPRAPPTEEQRASGSQSATKCTSLVQMDIKASNDG